MRGLIATEERREGLRDPFDVEIVAESAGVIEGASGLAITAHSSVDEVTATDVVIVPSMEFGREGEWAPGRYPKLVTWLRGMYDGGATICSACTGANLTAEAGLLDGHVATVHWKAENSFRKRHPDVQLRPNEALVVAGEGGRLVTSGAATAWHDLALYLIASHVGPATAQAVARFLLWEWHREGQAAFQVFDPPTDHGDAAILTAQRAIAESFAVAAPVEEMARWSGLAPRTFKRRFKLATGHTPISYVQQIRVERAKRLLETCDVPVEEVSWSVGYEDPASFRRLFKRLTGLAPGAYRQRFFVPMPAVSP
ncbi:MAG TPA: helix-turn-helix domain-containing protein [Solirubrobacterales bacterium]|nr:helix-turn-helix domain-containing protein [Solirubrobacterales bacterium]